VRARRERHVENEESLRNLCTGPTLASMPRQTTPRQNRPRGAQKDPAARARNCSCSRRKICLYAFFDLWQGQPQDAAAARSCRRSLTHGARDRQYHGHQVQEQNVRRLPQRNHRRKIAMAQDRQSSYLRSTSVCLKSCLFYIRASTVCPRSSCACVSPSRTSPSLTLGASGLLSATGFGASYVSYIVRMLFVHLGGTRNEALVRQDDRVVHSFSCAYIICRKR
jgi:hypothetical protein